MLFDKTKNKIVIVHYGNIMLYPPVLNLIENLLDNEYKVVVIAGNTNKLPTIVLNNKEIKIQFLQ